MKSKTIFSDSQILNNYFRLVRLLVFNKEQTFSSTKTAIRIKLFNKKFLLRFYKKLLRFKKLSNFLHTQIIFSYCLLKRYFFIYIPWLFRAFFNCHNIAFFFYHFLTIYRAIFLLKMIMDWFPVRNWDRASPLKRFLRRVTIGWTKEFEKYFPSIFAWLIVINMVPILMSFIETFFVTNNYTSFLIGYNFDELLEFVIESNLRTFK